MMPQGRVFHGKHYLSFALACLLFIIWNVAMNYRLEGTRCASSAVSTAADRLALVFPCTPTDVWRVIARLESGSASSCSGNYKSVTSAIFYFSNLNFTSDDAKRLDRELQHLRASLGKCFSSIQVMAANLSASEEGYPVGINYMFYRVFKHAEMRGFTWMFWCEHDVFPIRALWLDLLYERAASSGKHCWLLGSVYLGRMFDVHLMRPAELSVMYEWLPHINGNALWLLYSATTEPDLAAYMQFLEDYSAREVAFDVAFWQYIFKPSASNWPRLQRHAHRYCYDDFIQNWFGTALNTSTIECITKQHANTFLIHSDANSVKRARTIARAKNEFLADEAFARIESKAHNVFLRSPQTASQLRRPTLVVFLHIPRTGGSTIKHLADWTNEQPELLALRSHWWTDDNNSSAPFAPCTWCPVHDSDYVLLGSFSPRVFHALPALHSNFSTGTATIFREPLQRILSHHDFLRARGRTTLTLREFALKQQNVLHFQLGLEVPYSSSECRSDKEIRELLLDRLSVVGLYEEMEQTLAMFGAAFDWPVSQLQNFYRIGSQESRAKRGSVTNFTQLSIGDREFLQEVNACDVRLYNVAKSIFQSQIEACALLRSRKLRNLKISVFIRTHREDASFAARTALSVIRYFPEHHEIVMMCPEEDIDAFAHLLPENASVSLVKDKPKFKMNGHIRHKFNKLTADLHTSGRYILHLDSDVILRGQIFPEEMFVMHKPIIEYAAYSDLPRGAQIWQKGTSFSVGRKVDYEFSRWSDHIYPRQAYAQARVHIETLHNVSFEEYLSTRIGRMQDLPEIEQIHRGNRDETSFWRLFSDFNYMGAYLFFQNRGLMAWNLNYRLTRSPATIQFNSRRLTSPEQASHLLAIMDIGLDHRISCSDLAPRLKVYMGDELLQECAPFFNTTTNEVEKEYLRDLRAARRASKAVK